MENNRTDDAHNNNLQTVLLWCSPMENEEVHKVNEHYEFLVFVIYVFGKDMCNVVAVVGDNCTSREMSRRILLSFVGFHSHHFNLYVQDKI